MISDFLKWWAQHLKAALPRQFAGGGAGGLPERGLAIAVHLPPDAPPGVDVSVRRKGRDVSPRRFTLDAAGIAALRAAAEGQGPASVLRLPPDLLLEQQVVLPLAAERDPERVLHYEMDRITPFTADELFWTWAIERRDRANGRLHLRLSLVPKARLAGTLDALAAAGLRPTVLDAPALDGSSRPIALNRAQPARWQARALTAGWAACAVLAIAAAAIPFAVQSAASARVEDRIAALRPQVDQVEALRRRILGSTSGTDVFAEQRARVGDALGVLATLTDALPDDTVLNELSLRARMATISGHSAGAARLIPALAANPAIRNPAFAAPVTRNEGSRGEGFSIRAEMLP